MILPTKEFLEVFKKTEGALSVCESIAIMNIAAQSPNEVMDGLYYEFGSYFGKSSMSAMVGFKKGRFMLVDPIFEDEKIFTDVLKRVYDKTKDVGVGLTAGYSTDILPQLSDISYVFVDSGDHGEELVQAEVKLLEDRIVPNGIIAFHDYKNQFTAVERGYNQLVATGKYEPIPIGWDEIISYVRENNLEEGNSSWHMPDNPFPNFVGAVKRLPM